MENRRFNDDLSIDQKCFICQGDFEFFLTHHDSYLKTSDKRYNIYRCVNCGLLKFFPEPTVDEIKTFYPENYYSYNSTANTVILEKLKDEILRIRYKIKMKSLPMRLLAHFFVHSIKAVPLDYPKHNGKFLDIGCGDGYWLDKLDKYGWDCTGVEFMGKDGNKILIGDFSKMDFDEKFEFIRLSHVIEHVVNPDKYLLKIKSLLDKGGECHISLPNTGSIYFKIFGRYWFALDIPRHLQSFNYENFKLLLKKCGLKVKRVDYSSRGSFGSCLLNFFNIFFNLNLTDRYFICLAASVTIDKFFDILKSGDSMTIIIENEYV